MPRGGVRMAKAAFKVLGVLFLMGMAIKLCGDAVSENDRARPASIPASSNAPTAAAAALAPKPQLVQGAELVRAYDKNEVAADNVYKKQRLRVVGKIRSIGKDITDDPYVTIGESFKGVNCYFDSDKAGIVATLSKGDPIVLEGECRGLTMGSVILRDCSI